MNKNLLWKLILIIVLVIVAVWKVYPPAKTLKPGIDLGGGTTLIYEIDTQGLNRSERRNLAQRMITVLRRRIDPTNIQNLVWRPQGDSRFEVQMPLASKETRQKRAAYEEALDNLLQENVNPARIVRSLTKSEDERQAEFQEIAENDPNRMEILDTLAEAYDNKQQLQEKRDTLSEQISQAEQAISSSPLDLEEVKANRTDWAKLSNEELTEAVRDVASADVNDMNNVPVDAVRNYVDSYDQWRKVMEDLTNPETGANVRYKEARRALDQLNISAEQVQSILELDPENTKRQERLQQLKEEFPGRAEQIKAVVSAYKEYRPYRGRLDDPRDLQRMLKGAGILEFRILPTVNHPEVDMDLVNRTLNQLQEKGPKYASNETRGKYVWVEVENPAEWIARSAEGQLIPRMRDSEERPVILGEFAGKVYVLASDDVGEEAMLHGSGEKEWKLVQASPTSDQMGRRAISFTLDDRGGSMFWKLTGPNQGRPLAILLDNTAISAPVLQARISTDGTITGSFSQQEVQDMVNKLNAGSLPARLIEQPISVNTIGPSIGADNRRQGIMAGLIGLATVIVIMLVYYTLAGSIADIALLMNMLFILGAMALLDATFTLPGIAGLILTIGMSVDANVLIFERIREEQKKGSALRIAISNGYSRAFRTIFDANLTTLITAAILYGVASEEIKGFAIVLMLGIGSSMFTALFVTRVIFDLLLSKKIIKDKLVMLTLIHRPNVNWMKLRPVFFTISLVLILGGLAVFFTRDDAVNNKYDIEFTGGTSVQINLKPSSDLTRQEIEQRIHEIGKQQNNALVAANVYSVGKTGRSFEINTTATNNIQAQVTLPQNDKTEAEITEMIRKAEAEANGQLLNLTVTKESDSPPTFTVKTSQMNQTLVKNVLSSAMPDAQISELKINETVNDAIMDAFADDLEVQQSLQPQKVEAEKITESLLESYPELNAYLNGVKVSVELGRATTAAELDERFELLLHKPETRDLQRNPYKILNAELNPIRDPNESLTQFTYVSVPSNVGAAELQAEDWQRFVENEKTKIQAATTLEGSLPRVRQFDPSVGNEQKTRALIAIVLSLIAIITYIWVRFGNFRYGLAAILALVHDVCITLGTVTATAYIAQYAIGEALLIGDFKINLAIIAAFLTLIGYSLNDTIVVFDRIRENRAKAQLTAQTITNSINQTITRTIMTSFTTFIVVLIMYIFGGDGLRGFTFAIGFGVIVGTYSSIAIAAPVLLIGTEGQTSKGKGKGKK